MKPQIFVFLLIALLLSCKDEVTTTDSLLKYLPPNAALIIKINNLPNFKSELKNNSFLNKMDNLELHENISRKVSNLENINSDATCVLAFYEIGKKNYEIVLVSKNTVDFFNTKNVSNKTIETLNYQDRNIKKYSLDDSGIYSIIEDSTIILTSSMMLMENMVRAKVDYPIDSELKKLYETSEINKPATLFLNLREPSSMISSQLIEGRNKLGDFCDWISLDFSANSDNLNFNGIAIASDSTKNFINLFKRTNPLTNKTPLIAPLNAQAIISYTFDDYLVFAKNQNNYLDRTKRIDSLFNTIEELGIIYSNSQKAIILNSFGTESLSEFLDVNKTSSSIYQGSEILSISAHDLLTKTFDPLVTDFESKYYTILENAFIFSEKKEILQTIINNYKTNSSFGNTDFYKSAMASLANESTILFISNASGIDFFTEKEFPSTFYKSIKEKDFSDHTFAAQVVAEENFAHINFLVSKIEKPVKTKTVTPLFTLELDTDLANKPQFVKNHRTSKQEIVVQDQNNFLYLISTEGKVLWKKQLEGRIQDKIHQVDIYKNGRLQIAFCTNNKFSILDRNGNEVSPFKKTFEGGNLNPLAVFDYEGKKDYRFIVTQGEKVFMYNNKAQIVDGFIYTKAESPIMQPPKHFRIFNKDYLIFQLENQSLKILHRTGRERIKVDQKIDFSSNETYLYKNKFSITNNKGVLHQIDTKGKLTSTNFNLNKDHGMYATNNTLVFMDDNILSIRGKKVELELGVYTKPKIFYIYDKIYVSVTDIQNQKIYLFDSQALPIANFPVFGNSIIDLADMDNDRKLELVAKDQENSIIVYKIN